MHTAPDTRQKHSSEPPGLKVARLLSEHEKDGSYYGRIVLHLEAGKVVRLEEVRSRMIRDI